MNGKTLPSSVPHLQPVLPFKGERRLATHGLQCTRVNLFISSSLCSFVSPCIKKNNSS